jgi:photosystem II stability/assembly factor-like uncharacterized protein
VSIVHLSNWIAPVRPFGRHASRAAAICLALWALLSLILPATAEAAEPGTVWERDGLAGLKVRSLTFTADASILVGLTLGEAGSSPLWVRRNGAWSQPATDLPNSILSTVALPEGGVLLGTARDISERPGVFWLGGEPLASRRLYDAQAIGALAVARVDSETRVYAAAAPYGDREAGAHLLRWNQDAASWLVVLEGTLFCGDLSSYFKQIVVARDGSGTVLAVEECFASVSRQTQLWRSDDHGESWRVLPRSGIEQPLIGAIALEPGDATVLYLVGLSQEGHASTGLERSLDGGRSWSPIGGAEPELSHSRVVTPDPHGTGRLFAAGEQGGVFVSSDRGASWQSLPGLEQLRVWSLCLDGTSSTLFAGTSDGVWRMALPYDAPHDAPTPAETSPPEAG